MAEDNWMTLSIMPLDEAHVDEICADVVDQQRRGISTHAMFMMKFNPVGTPPVNRAEAQCRIYDLFRDRLDRAGARHGVLVQATLGHIVVPEEPYPFQPTVSLLTGEESVVTCCPLDPGFRAYLREQMRILGARHPSAVMIDDDVGILYRLTKGCACPYHMAELNRRAGIRMTREELLAHTRGESAEDRRCTELYVQVQHDALIGAVEAMRAGLDESDPSIQGIVSGIYTTSFCEFSGDTAEAFAGKGNPRIVRLNGGPYAKPGTKGFTANFFRAAVLRENVRSRADLFLAETDTCPQNRYSTSAAMLHAHFSASILEGASGAKHWITRLGNCWEPSSGRAYREILAKNAGFYRALTGYARDLKPFGCRIPLSRVQDYGFVPERTGDHLSPWSTCVLERLGLPLFFGNEDGGAVFLDDISADRFDDREIRRFLAGTLILSSGAAQRLTERGFGDYVGVAVSDWDGKVITGEAVLGNRLPAQFGVRRLTPRQDSIECLSEVIHTNRLTGEAETLFPGVTRFDNPLGGETVVFSGTPDMPFRYHTAFSMLCETRKQQFVEILSRRGNLPLYCPEDGDLYLRTGRLEAGGILAVLFNLSFDVMEDIPLATKLPVRRVRKLCCDGTLCGCAFSWEDGGIRVAETLLPLTPAVLLLD